MTALVPLSGCRNRGGQVEAPHHLSDHRDLQPEEVDAAFRADWEALQSLREREPESPQVVEAADRLLERDPPLPLALASRLAKAEALYLMGRDPLAVQTADLALASTNFDPADPPDILVALAVVRVRALARGGDPAGALEALESPLLAAPGGLAGEERLGLRAVALDRNAQFADAAVAFVQWRAELDDDDPAAAYAASRFTALTGSLPAQTLQERARALPESSARICLEVRSGLRLAAGGSAPSWVEELCHAGARKVGILLPRSGRLAALADTQLAAASVAIEVLRRDADVDISWEDSGSTPARATQAAQHLLSDGATVLVGPIGPTNVRAVGELVSSRVDVIVPGEGTSGAVGVAPTLEERVIALIERGRAAGVRRFLVAAPSNGYGKRAVEAVRATLSQSELKSLTLQMYPVSTTSFAPVLAPLLPKLGPKTALIVPDHLARVELVVRQLVRAGHSPSPEGADGPLVLTTGEGASPAIVGDGHEVLDGLWIAPAALVSEAANAFVDAYADAQGEPPGDQALLVFYALRRAMLGEGASHLDAGVARVEGGRLVVPKSN